MAARRGLRGGTSPWLPSVSMATGSFHFLTDPLAGTHPTRLHGSRIQQRVGHLGALHPLLRFVSTYSLCQEYLRSIPSTSGSSPIRLTTSSAETVSRFGWTMDCPPTIISTSPTSAEPTRVWNAASMIRVTTPRPSERAIIRHGSSPSFQTMLTESSGLVEARSSSTAPRSTGSTCSKKSPSTDHISHPIEFILVTAYFNLICLPACRLYTPVNHSAHKLSARLRLQREAVDTFSTALDGPANDESARNDGYDTPPCGALVRWRCRQLLPSDRPEKPQQSSPEKTAGAAFLRTLWLAVRTLGPTRRRNSDSGSAIDHEARIAHH